MPRGRHPFIGSFDFDADRHRSRIVSDGGMVTNLRFLSTLIRDLKAGGCYSILDGLWIPVAIRKDASDKVSTIYDLSLPKSGGVYYDCTQSNASMQQTWQDNQIDAKPWLMCISSAGGYLASGVASIAQPVTGFIICRKDSAGSVYRVVCTCKGGATGVQLFTYNNNTTQAVNHPGTTPLVAATTQSTLGQFTSLVNGAGSNIRRKGTSLATGGAGTASTDGYSIGSDFDGTGLPHNGPIAFCASIRQAITTTQRDYIELLLNSKYYPSTA